jgi:hypothetical protein
MVALRFGMPYLGLEELKAYFPNPNIPLRNPIWFFVINDAVFSPVFVDGICIQPRWLRDESVFSCRHDIAVNTVVSAT